MADIALPVDQQLAREPGMLGASDSAAALGLDPYRSPMSVWRALRGLHVPDERPEAVVEAAEWGQTLEPVVRGKYALVTRSAVVVPTKSRIHPDRRWLRATPDGFTFAVPPEMERARIIGPGTWSDENVIATTALATALAHGLVGLYQGKTCSAYLASEWEERPPARYEVQVRVEMAVTNTPWCDVACLVGGQRFRGPFRVHRDLKLEENILTDLDAFHALVESGTEPSVDASRAWREHVSAKLERASATIEAPTAEMLNLIDEWRTARSLQAKVKADVERLKTDVMLRMSAAGAKHVKLPTGGQVTAYKTGARSDWKGYAISLGGAAKPPEKFRGESKTYALRAPGGDDDE